MKSITEGPFKMGTFIQTPTEETEGALQPGLEWARVFTDLSAKEKERFIQPTNDPLALVSNASVQQYPTHSSMSPNPNEPHLLITFNWTREVSSTDELD
ncbi:hypothetical protein Tco_0237240 [Tanacetum coccineum]